MIKSLSTAISPTLLALAVSATCVFAKGLRVFKSLTHNNNQIGVPCAPALAAYSSPPIRRENLNNQAPTR